MGRGLSGSRTRGLLPIEAPADGRIYPAPEVAVNKPDSFFYAIRLETTAMNAFRACRRLTAGSPLNEYEREALGRARTFVEAARSGARIKSSRRLSATPTFDLLAYQYTREALPDVVPAGEFANDIESLSTALDTGARVGRIEDPQGRWDSERMADYWKKIFWLAATLSSMPTDRRRRTTEPQPSAIAPAG